MRIHLFSQNPYFFNVDKLFNIHITNHDKKFDLYLFKKDFNLFFNSFIPHIKIHFHHNNSIFNWRRYLLYWIE